MEKGTLYIVATPIGNLEDITIRAVNILKMVDIIAAEDTRQTIKLLNHLSIKKHMESYYEHNKEEKGKYLIKLLLEGKNIALVSDAGTPGISDPGELLVRQAIDEEINVTMAPGAVAFIMGLVLSGFPTGRFVFEGFLPMNKRGRKERLNQLKSEFRTLVFYEAPHKLKYTLKDLLEVLGDRRICFARELTKRYEEIYRTTISEAVKYYEDNSPKGEFVLIVEASDEILQIDTQNPYLNMDIKSHVALYVNEGIDKMSAIKKVAKERGLNKRDVYTQVI
jgi:16S rRNA (cytidine1402-2'-O)-methyltransferase